MQNLSIVIAVKNINQAMERIKNVDGEILGESMSIPGIGEYVSFIDTEENRNSVLQPSPHEKTC